MATNQQSADRASGDPRPLTEPQQISNDNDLGPLPDGAGPVQTEMGEREQGIRTERSNDILEPATSRIYSRAARP